MFILCERHRGGAVMADKFLVIDGSSLIHRAFFALPPLTTRQGIHTGAVYGLCNMLLKLFTILKRGRKAFHDGVLLRCKPVRVCRVNGGEIPVQHLLLAAFQQYGPPVQINAVQQVSAIQAEFRMFPDEFISFFQR